MAYDETMAARVRANLANRSGIAERKMFGGLAFMLDGNMCCCVIEHGLIARVGRDAYAEALARPHARPMDVTGRPMRGWVLVDFAGLETERDLSRWVEQGAEFAATLPPK